MMSPTPPRAHVRYRLKIPWYLEDRLAEIGVYYHKARIPFRPFIVQDRHLYTGQNPASSEALAHCLLDDIG